MTTLADVLGGASEAELDDFICRNDPAAWAERKRGFKNAPFQEEWYRLGIEAQRVTVIAPRDHSKSEVFTVNLSSWRSIYRPGTWTYVFAATGDLAKELKSRIDSAISEHRPDLVDGATKKTTQQTVYTNGSRVTVAGAGAAVRGAHPDVIIGDDVLEEESSLTEHQRQKTKRWWLGTVGGMPHPGKFRRVPQLGRVWMNPTQVFLVGTPFHASDLLMGMKTNEVYEYRRYAAEYDPAELVPGTWAVEVARSSTRNALHVTQKGSGVG